MCRGQDNNKSVTDIREMRKAQPSRRNSANREKAGWSEEAGYKQEEGKVANLGTWSARSGNRKNT